MRHPMITVEDFTGLSEGRDVDEGPILCCPRCGRNGVVHRDADSDYVVHVQTLELLGDGLRDEPRDCCTVGASERQGDGEP